MVEIYTAYKKGEYYMKTHKIMEINTGGKHFFCIYDENKESNRYILYEKWYDNGWHRKKIGEYINFLLVIEYLRKYSYDNMWGLRR